MAELTAQTIVREGVTPNLAAAAADGDSFDNDGSVFVEIANSSGVNAYTLTFETTGSIKGVPLEDTEVSIAASGNKLIGPFPPEAFGSSVSVTYSGSAVETDLTIGVFKGM